MDHGCHIYPSLLLFRAAPKEELRLVSYKSYARFVSMALATHTLHTHDGQREGLPSMTSAKILATGYLPLSTFWT